jgi:hypothetical protein
MEGKHVTRCKGGFHASDTFGDCYVCGRRAGEPCLEAPMTAEERRRLHVVTCRLVEAEALAAEEAFRKAQARLRAARENLAKACEGLIQAVTEENTDGR